MKNACFLLRIFLFSAILSTFSAELYAGPTAANEDSNLAQKAFVTTSKISNWERLSSVNDGFEPLSSTDRTHGIYGNWDGESEYGVLNWVQYEWPSVVTLSSASVYWYSDGGGILQPTIAYMEHWVDGAWKRTGTMGVVLDKWNSLALNGLQTTKIRLNMQSSTATGIAEFKVMGVQGVVDQGNALECKRQIQCLLDSISWINLGELPRGYFSTVSTYWSDAKFRITAVDTLARITACLSTLSSFHQELKHAKIAWLRLSACVDSARILLADAKLKNRENLQNACNVAYATQYSSNAFLIDVTREYQSLSKILSDYYFNPYPYNLATVATVSTSYKAPWETLSALNDGLFSTTSEGIGVLRYTNWNGEADWGLTNWVQYDWNSDKAVRTVSVYWYTDGQGVTLPDSAVVEYWKDDQWHLSGRIGVLADTFNVLPVDAITSRLRLAMKSKTATGIIEFSAEGYETAAAPKSTGLKQVDTQKDNTLGLFCSESDSQPWSLSNPTCRKLSVTLYDAYGRTVYTVISDLQTLVLPTSALSGKGLYLVRVAAVDGNILMVNKILVQ